MSPKIEATRNGDFLGAVETGALTGDGCGALAPTAVVDCPTGDGFGALAPTAVVDCLTGDGFGAVPPFVAALIISPRRVATFVLGGAWFGAPATGAAETDGGCTRFNFELKIEPTVTPVEGCRCDCIGGEN